VGTLLQPSGPHLAPHLLRIGYRGWRERRMRNLILALATLAGVLMMAAANAAHSF